MAASSAPDPREILGVGPCANADEIAAAYRREAKRCHPDRVGDARSGDRMALVNAAYAALRASSPVTSHPAAGDVDERPAPEPQLALVLRRAIGDELGAVLDPGEAVELVTGTATWASPQALLAITDRRILWLLDDAPVHRVRWLRRADVRRVTSRPPRFWRAASVTIEDRRGRRFGFGELSAPTAEAVVRRVASDRQTTFDSVAG